MIYPLTICFDRYNGVYSGGAYTAWNCDSENVPTEISDDDVTCCAFWGRAKARNKRNDDPIPEFGIGSTVEAAIEDLRKKLNAVKEDFSVDECFKKYEEATRNDIFCIHHLKPLTIDDFKNESVVPVAKVREALGLGGTDDDIFGEIRKLKKERDELKDKVRRLRIEANSHYGASCGYSEYSGDKEPAFHCNVISYSWEFSSIGSNSIRVELDLTPTANYKGTFDMEDLKHYIQEYGREKKLGVLEKADYQIAKTARVELAELYKRIFGAEKLDRSLSPKDISKAILDEVDKLRDDWAAQKEKKYELIEFRDSVCDILSTTTAMSDLYILKRIEKLKDQESSKIERLEKFRRDVAERIGRNPDLLNTPEVIMYALDIVLERGEQMDKLRDKMMDILGYEPKALRIDKNNEAILEKVKELKEAADHDKIFREAVCDAISTTTAVSDIFIYNRIRKLDLDHEEIKQKYSRYCLAIGSLCSIPEEHREDISWIEDAFNSTKKDYLKLKADVDKLSRLRSNICTELCLGHESCDGNIIGRIRMNQDGHKKLRNEFREEHPIDTESE